MSEKSLRNKVIRLAHSKPELREHLLPLVKKNASREIVYYAVMNNKDGKLYYFGATKSQKGAIRVATKKRDNLGFAIDMTKKMNKEEILEWCNMRKDMGLHEAQILFAKPQENDIVIKWVYDDVSSVTNAKIVSGANPYFLSRKDKGMWKKFQSWVSSKF